MRETGCRLCFNSLYYLRNFSVNVKLSQNKKMYLENRTILSRFSREILISNDLSHCPHITLLSHKYGASRNNCIWKIQEGKQQKQTYVLCIFII